MFLATGGRADLSLGQRRRVLAAVLAGGVGGAFGTVGAGFALSLAISERVHALERRREAHPLPQPQPRLPPAT